MPHRFPVITISRLFGSGGHSIATRSLSASICIL